VKLTFSFGIFAFLSEMKKIAHERDQEKKAKSKTEFLEIKLPNCLSKFENILKSKDFSVHLVGKKLTWVDIYISTMLDRFGSPLYAGPSYIDAYPNLKAFRKATYSQPGIKEWIERRPKE
jgi:glutathione S-transferase